MSRTRTQEFVSSITHGVTGLLAIAGLIILMILSVSHRTPWHVVGFAIYGTSLILLYFSSFFYHLIGATRGFHKSFQTIDYIMINILIAGTYTPITLISLRGGWGWTIFSLIWGMAITGIILRLKTKKFQRWVPAVFYLVMGWLIIIAIKPLSAALPAPALWLLFTGGFFYTLGTGFFALEKYVKLSSRFGMHELFHIFVILGSGSHFVMMYRYI